MRPEECIGAIKQSAIWNTSGSILLPKKTRKTLPVEHFYDRGFFKLDFSCATKNTTNETFLTEYNRNTHSNTYSTFTCSVRTILCAHASRSSTRTHARGGKGEGGW